jgi:hypothetical protein
VPAVWLRRLLRQVKEQARAKARVVVDEDVTG